MKNGRKVISGFILVCVLVMTFILCGNVTVYAKSKDVTKTFSDKENVNQILKDSCYYTWQEFMWSMKKGETQKLDFSKAANRKKVIALYIPQKYNVVSEIGKNYKQKYVTAASKNLFGKNTNNKNVRGGVYMITESDYKIKITSIKKTGDKKYRVVYNYSVKKAINSKKYKKLGTIALNIKKNSNSCYGYVLTSMELKKTANKPASY